MYNDSDYVGLAMRSAEKHRPRFRNEFSLLRTRAFTVTWPSWGGVQRAAFNGRQTSGLGHNESKAVFWQNGTEKEGDPRNKGAANRMNQNKCGSRPEKKGYDRYQTCGPLCECQMEMERQRNWLVLLLNLQLHEKYLAHTDRQTVRQTDKHSTISTRVLEMRQTIDMSYFAITIQHSSSDWRKIKRSGRPRIEIASWPGVHWLSSMKFFLRIFVCLFVFILFFVYFFSVYFWSTIKKVGDTHESWEGLQVIQGSGAVTRPRKSRMPLW
jgi:hypothetical protein